MRFLLQIFDFFAGRYLLFRGSQHLRSGFPSIAAFAFDHIGHEINLKGRYETAELDATFNFLKRSGLIMGTAVDVGANIGNHSLFFADHFEHVISLEPNPRVFELLSFNAKLRDNIQSLNIGASDVSGIMELSFEPSNWGTGHLGVGPMEVENLLTVSVHVKKLDELEELASRHVGLIKIDVEGHELCVLRGAVKLMARSRPVVLLEQHPDEISQGSSDVIDWLRANKYDRFFEVRSFPNLPRGWIFPGRKAVNGLVRLVVGEDKRVVPIKRFEKAFYPMIIALPSL